MKINLGGLSIPEDAFYHPWGVLAMRGAGKTNAAAVMAEGLYKAKRPFVVVDPVGAWWGLRSSADGKSEGLSVPILGGDHADIPLEDSGGNDVADFLITERASCVVDVSALSEGGKHRFLADFAERLLRKNEDPLVVFLEEADDYAPQRVTTKGPAAVTLGRMQALVKRGRFKGLTPVMVTQRSAAINKDLLTQIENLVVLRTTSPQDRKAIAGWVETHGASKDLLDSLPGLEDGEAWLWSPHALKILKRFQFRLRSTFDSGATPKAGARRAATLADVDLAALQARMKETIERAKEEDPRELKKVIAGLRAELQAKSKERPQLEPEVVEKIVEVPVLTEDDRLKIDGARKEIARAVDALNGKLGTIENLDTSLEAIVVDAVARAEKAIRSRAPIDSGGRIPARSFPGPKPTPSVSSKTVAPVREAKQSDNGEVALKAGARRMLEVLARHSPMRLTRAQLATLSGMKITGGTFQTYYGILKREGLMEVDSGGLHAITADGASIVPEAVGTAATSTEEIVEMYRSKLKAGARKMLDVLIDEYPHPVERTELAAEIDMEPSGGTFQTYLGHLRRNGLAEVDGSMVRAGEALFLGG
jgi:hypothetical protein